MNREEIIKKQDMFLNRIVTPQSTYVGAEGHKLDISLPESVISSVTQVLGPVLPMTIRTYSQTMSAPIHVILLINPENFNRGKTNTTNAAYTRNGWITQLWGPNQEMISATGKTAAFMVEGEGLTAVGERRSAAFRNFMALVASYRNNGYEYFDPIAKTRDYRNTSRVISRVRGIELYYDGDVYYGHFNNLTIDNDAEEPFQMNYSFEYVISSTDGDGYAMRGHYAPIPEPAEGYESQLLSDVEEEPTTTGN